MRHTQNDKESFDDEFPYIMKEFGEIKFLAAFRYVERICYPETMMFFKKTN